MYFPFIVEFEAMQTVTSLKNGNAAHPEIHTGIIGLRHPSVPGRFESRRRWDGGRSYGYSMVFPLGMPLGANKSFPMVNHGQ